MRSHRLQRLTQLTRGVALIGIGLSAEACASDPPNVNGPSPQADTSRRSPPSSTASIDPPAVAPPSPEPSIDASPPSQLGGLTDAGADAALAATPKKFPPAT